MNPSTCFGTVAARTMERAGKHRDPTLLDSVGHGLWRLHHRLAWRIPFHLRKSGSRTKNRRQPLSSNKSEARRCVPGGASADPSVFRPSRLSLLLLALLHCQLFASRLRGCVCTMSSSFAGPSGLAFGGSLPRPIPNCSFAASSAAASLCHEITAEASLVTNAHLAERLGRRAPTAANPTSGRGGCPSPLTCGHLQFGTSWHAVVPILQAISRRWLLPSVRTCPQ